MQHFAKVFAKRAAVPVTAAAVGVPSAHARVSPNVPAGPISKLEDEWMLPSVNGHNVLFKPYNAEEIDQCCDEISALFGGHRPAAGPSVTISELSPEGSECTLGVSADSVIEGADVSNHHGAPRMDAQNVQNEQLGKLLSLASKMLRRPGLQSEVFACMMEDVEVRELMMTQCDDLDAYLVAAGVPMGSNRFLLAGDATSSAGSTATDNLQGDVTSRDGPDLMAAVIGAVSSLLQRTGGMLAFLGGWLRDRFAHARPHNEAGPSGGSPAFGNKRNADTVLGSVMVLVVAIVCMLVVRRPMRFRCA